MQALDIVRTEVGLSHLVGDVHCIIEAMIGRGGRNTATATSEAGSSDIAASGYPGSVMLLEPQIGPGVPTRVLCDPDRSAFCVKPSIISKT